MSTSYGNPQIVTDGLALCLDAGNSLSYPGSGTTWSDLSGNGNSGTLINGPTFNSANGGSIVFDGTNDYVSAPKQTAFVDVSQFTLMSWMKRRTASSKVVMHQGATLFVDVSMELWSDNNAYFEVGNGSNQYAFANNTSTAWQYLAMVFDGGQTGNLNRLKCYINGSLLEVSYDGVIPSTTGNPDSIFAIGNTEGSGFSNFSDGNIAQVLIYSQALSPQEILQNYNATKGRFGL
jgi:hypothetical protein